MEQVRPNSRSALSSLSLDQTRQYGQKPTMDQVGKAFETLFVQTMLKSMRDAQIEGGLLDSEHSKPFQSMLDGIYSEMSVKRTNLGLAEAINRQFSTNNRGNSSKDVGTPQAALNATTASSTAGALPKGIIGNEITGSNSIPISELTTRIATQQGASLKTIRPLNAPMSAHTRTTSPKLTTGD